MQTVNLAKYQPQFYKDSEFIKAINSAIEAEFVRLKEACVKMLSEAVAKTAVEWLPVWEQSVGLPVGSGLTVSRRQSRVLARLRQMDATTKERIKIIVESYTNGEAEITELFDKYTVLIYFVGSMGIPENMNGIIEQLDRLMPAHLATDYQYKWRTWADVLNSGKTWGELLNAGYTWRDLMEREVL